MSTEPTDRDPDRAPTVGCGCLDGTARHGQRPGNSLTSLVLLWIVSKNAILVVEYAIKAQLEDEFPRFEALVHSLLRARGRSP